MCLKYRRVISEEASSTSGNEAALFFFYEIFAQVPGIDAKKNDCDDSHGCTDKVRTNWSQSRIEQHQGACGRFWIEEREDDKE